MLEVVVFFHNPLKERALFESILSVDIPEKIIEEKSDTIKAKIVQEKSDPEMIWSEISLHSDEPIKIEIVNNLVVLYGNTINSGDPIDSDRLFGKGWKIDDGTGYNIKYVPSNTLGYVLFRARILSAQGE